MANYIPHTKAEQKEMLEVVGAANLDALYSSVPSKMKLKNLNLPVGKTEAEVRGEVETLAAANKSYRAIFRGAGAYNHYIPAIVGAVVGREEFVTAYTPYQPEISQGILQSIFEYQSMITALTGMDVSNASVYDGATAAAEAVAMCRERKRTVAYVSATVKPANLEVIKTYAFGASAEVVVVPAKDGATDVKALRKLLDAAPQTAACVYTEQPNFYGIIEDGAAIAEIAHSVGAKYIVGTHPIFCAAYKTPAEVGADIAVGEGQPLGLPINFGGPYLGFMTAKNELVRKLPGRIVGQTTDHDGRRAFVLTLQAREQHIRREKASSNICSNEAHCALTAGAYMAAMGPDGMKKAALLCASKAAYLAAELDKIGYKTRYKGAFWNEFLTDVPTSTTAKKILAALDKKGVLGGLEVEGGILWAVTENNTKAQIDGLIEIIKGAK